MIENMEENLISLELDSNKEEAEIFEFKDRDGDRNIGIVAGEYTVFATEQISGRWSLNFGLTKEIDGSDWMDTLTSKGAFSTMIELKPAISKIIKKLEEQGSEWGCCCDAKRAKLYSRYIPIEKIQIVE